MSRKKPGHCPDGQQKDVAEQLCPSSSAYSLAAGYPASALPFMPFWQVTVLTGGLWGISWGCAMWFIYWGPSGMVAGEAIIISITGGFCPDCSWPLSTGGAGKLTGCHHGMMCKPCTGVFLRSGTFIYLYANLHSCIVTGLQPLRHFQRIALPAYHPAFFIP